jgi:tRNA threonylcarbamoyl adenosine modification protein (Sua5/YciO/YrdC/YwlC family)
VVDDATYPLLRVALAQINPTVGDLDGNAAKVCDAIASAREAGAQLLLVPEQVITGYPAEDLWLKEHVLRETRAALDEIAARAEGIVALVGFPELAEDVYNSTAVLADGAVQAVYRKVYLPNYGVFDEHRYFQVGAGGARIELGGIPIGLTICEDMWEPGPPASDEALAGALVLVNPSASPYTADKGVQRERMFSQRARDYTACVLFCNLVGGQDELVFDGHSLIIDHRGEVIARGAQFEEELLVATIDPGAAAAARLREGALVAYPTETFYGLGALASREDALRRLAAAKLRPADKALPLLAADVEQVARVASLDDPLARRLSERFWPGPLTLVLPARPSLSPLVTSGGSTVAIRVPGSAVARALASAAGGPLVSTSANLSGEPPPARAEDLSPTLVAALDLVLDAGPTPGGLPSTIVAIDAGAPRLVRPGAVPWEEIAAAR